MAKKRKGCLRRIISFIFVSCLIIFGLAIIFDDSENTGISEQEIAEGNEETDFGSLLDLFFDYYGYLPEDDNNYNFDTLYDDNSTDSYNNNDYDYEDYYNNFDKDNSFYDYFNDYYNDYDNQENTPSPAQSIEVYGGESAESITNSYIQKFVEIAKSFLGTPYVFGGTSRKGIDCSGLVYLSAKEAGLGTLPRTAKTLYSIASKIEKKDLEPGDLVFFSANNSISHVAIYIGDNQILHAVSEGKETGVIISKMSKDYWKNHYYSSGRIMSNEVTTMRAAARAETIKMSQKPENNTTVTGTTVRKKN